eukprot:1990997-Rhodomonas_salina.1
MGFGRAGFGGADLPRRVSILLLSGSNLQIPCRMRRCVVGEGCVDAGNGLPIDSGRESMHLSKALVRMRDADQRAADCEMMTPTSSARCKAVKSTSMLSECTVLRGAPTPKHFFSWITHPRCWRCQTVYLDCAAALGGEGSPPVTSSMKGSTSIPIVRRQCPIMGLSTVVNTWGAV